MKSAVCHAAQDLRTMAAHNNPSLTPFVWKNLKDIA
jgi:hypothetical protein